MNYLYQESLRIVKRCINDLSSKSNFDYKVNVPRSAYSVSREQIADLAKLNKRLFAYSGMHREMVLTCIKHLKRIIATCNHCCQESSSCLLRKSVHEIKKELDLALSEAGAVNTPLSIYNKVLRALVQGTACIACCVVVCLRAMPEYNEPCFQTYSFKSIPSSA